MNQVQQIELYRKQVYRKIPASPQTRARCMDVFNLSIEDYLAKYPESNMDDVVRTFGEPKEVAKQYEQEIDPDEIRKYKRRRILSWTIPLAVFLTLICVFLIIGYFYIIENKTAYIVESPAKNGISEHEFFVN